MATLLDGPALAAALRVKPQTVRSWASAGLLRRHGRDARGRTMYDLDEALGVSRRGEAVTNALPSTPDASGRVLPGQ